MLAACGSVPERHPVPAGLIERAEIPGMPALRFWGDVGSPVIEQWTDATPDELESAMGALYDREHHYLAISGGGENGAFGAGLLCGWTAHGDRPEFVVVTGISTGALSAPFAFLGPAYDAKLEEIYTAFHTSDLVEERGWLDVIGGDSLVDTRPLERLLERYMTRELIDAVAREHRRGRRLFVATSNLDAGRPVIWNMGRIAASGHPDADALFRKVLLASAAIPVAFPPVYFEVEVDGVRYDEMHVDGGATAQLFLFPVDVDWGAVREMLKVRGQPTAYVLRNAKVDPVYERTDPGLFGIAKRTMTSMIRTQGIGDLYRLHAQGLRDGIAMRFAYIPADFEHDMVEVFDPAYMKALFDRGYEMAAGGFPWHDTPPEFDLDDRDAGRQPGSPP